MHEVLIRVRNEKPSEAGTHLTANLIELVNSFIPVSQLHGVSSALTRLLIGDDTADLLGVGHARSLRLLVKLSAAESRLASRFLKESRLARGIARKISIAILDGFVIYYRAGERPRFNIPDHLAASMASPRR